MYRTVFFPFYKPKAERKHVFTIGAYEGIELAALMNAEFERQDHQGYELIELERMGTSSNMTEYGFMAVFRRKNR